jgi:hypothetical protein
VDKRAAGQYLDRLFGDRQGYVAVAYKDPVSNEGWQEHQFAWPSEKTKLLGWAEVHQDANVFICPALRQSAHTRKKGDMHPSRWLWADVDWQTIPAHMHKTIANRIVDFDSMNVQSGTGENVHVYVELSRDVPHDEFIKLNTGLRDYLLADNKQADNSLLRLPGTTNWKTPGGTPVAWVNENRRTGKGRSPESLLKLRAFRDAKVPIEAEATEWDFVEVEGLPRRIKALVNMPTPEAESRYGSRYKAVWAVVGDLHRRGFDGDTIHSLMDKFPPALSKAADENGYDVHRDVDKRLAWDRAKSPAMDADDEADEDAGELFEEVTAEEMMSSLVAEGVEKELLRRQIRRAADMSEAMAGHTQPPDDASSDLSDDLSMPPAPVQYLIDGLASATATVVITGQYKSGKTHLMIASLITSLADNEPFLGDRAVHVPEEGAVVGHWNLEMSKLDLVDKYARPAGFKNPHNVKIAHWQGYRLNILTPPGKAAAVDWLKTRGVQVWTIDSWSALCRMCGVDPNDNKEVGDLLGVITEIKVECDIRVVFLLAHTARASQDSEKPGTRGASALDEGVDTRWMFTVDKTEMRWLTAEGRGTQMSPVSLDFNEETGRSTLGSTRATAASDGWVQIVAGIVNDYPHGIAEAQLWDKMKQVRTVGKPKAVEYMVEAMEAGFIRREKGDNSGRGGRAPWMHYPAVSLKGETRSHGATPRDVDLRNAGPARGRRLT